MEVKLKRGRPIRRLSKVLFTILGGFAILLAVALGVFRLLVAQIPEYQTELKDWVAEELGLVVDFAVLNARLGFTGPQLTLREATIGGGREFLNADQATITLDPVALLFAGRVDFSRLTLNGVHLTVERDNQGTFRIGDFALVPGDGGVVESIPQSVEVAIRDSELIYVDALRERTWQFSDLDLVIESAGGDYVANATLSPPESLAGRIALRFDASLPTTDDESLTWQLGVDAQAVDLEMLATLIPIDPILPISGHGAVETEISWTDRQLTGFRLGVDVEDLSLDEARSAPYDSLRLIADWQRTGAGSWQIEFDGINVRRNGRGWEPSTSAEFSLETDNNGVQAVTLVSEFIRLEDLEPVVSTFPETQLAEQWTLFEPAGDIRDLAFSLQRRNSSFVYELDTSFAQVAVHQVGATPGIDGISGHVSATENSGTIEFRTEAFSLDWPSLFREVVEGESLTGDVVWWQSRDIVRIFSGDLGVGVLGHEASTSFALELPGDRRSATLDLRTELPAVDLVSAKGYLPTKIMPESVVTWVDRAVVGGQARDIELEVFGPLASFPFDAGDGRFRVAAAIENTSLDYMQDWPVADGIDGWIEFVNAGFLAGASGQTLSNRTENLAISIPDMRRPTLGLEVDTEGTLANVVEYLRAAPLIAERLGPGFERIEIRSGSGSISALLKLPLNNLSAFDLDAELKITEGTLAVRGFTPTVSEINGVMVAEEDTVSADGIDGVFLGGPITAALMSTDQAGYRAELTVEGETSAGALAESFDLSPVDWLDGQTLWRGRLMLPALDPLASMPPRISIESNLAGVALRLPEPLAKEPGEATNLSLDLRFASSNRLEVAGNLGATRRFAMQFQVDDDGLGFTRGAVEFGGGEPQLPVRTGILVGGQIETLDLDQWFDLREATDIGRAGAQFRDADVDVSSFHAFGQQLGETSLRVERAAAEWQIEVDSEAIAGLIVVPRGSAGREPIVAGMSRLYLAGPGEHELADVDPRSLRGIRIEAAEFGFGNRQLGRLSAIVETVPQGLVLTQFQSQTENFQTQATGSWLTRARGSRTTINAEILSTDVEAALAELGLDPVIEGESATVNASVHWDSAPTAEWLDHLNGDVGLLVETGTLREVDPGAGRVVGLMSIAALPRRLLLDFRDVFEQGFAFDEIGGNFSIIDGNAYTNDLKFGGPAAEIGVVGRTGLRDHDYQQQVVVTAEPGNMLPTVGGLLGGAGVGAALLIFTRLFKEPLKGIGRASYCLSGDWEAPAVDLISDEEPAEAERCAALPEEMLPANSDG